MVSVGEVLRQARLEQGLDLETVAARTKISVRCLAAIEADDRKSLPSGFFYKSFVDQYARILSLDTHEIDAEVDRVLSQDAPLPLPGYGSVVSRNISPMRVSPRFRNGRVWGSLAALIAVVAGCSGLYAWWHKASIGSVAVIAEKAVEPPEATPVSHPAAQMATHEVASSTPAATPSYKVLLDLMAHEETWLSITSDGKRLFSGILAANQTKTISGGESATMKVGNAAGLEVRLNGRLLGPLGARGQVLMVVFTPNDYQIVPPSPRAGD